MNLFESAGGLSISSLYLEMFKAEVLDRDLRDPLSDADVADLKKHLYTNLVLVFHDQCLTNAEFVTFAREFGTAGTPATRLPGSEFEVDLEFC